MTTHCPIVVDYIVPVSKPRARKTDPQTSHDAADSVSEKVCGVQRAHIYLLIKHFGPQTCSEISRRCKYDKVQIGRRIGEVIGIQPTGEQRNGERVWGLICHAKTATTPE